MASAFRVVGRYALFGEIATGGMATVHVGRMMGPAGFSRVVAMKRMHPQFAKDPEFVAMFLDEARVAARIRHPNVVASTDVVAADGELFIVMDYVEGESLARLMRLCRERGETPPVPVAAAIVVHALHGLHAAHEATSEAGMALDIIHRDISPQNILVGTDGLARVVDFGIAKAAGRSEATRSGVIKGKMAYMAPEQLMARPLDRRVDVYAASVVLWEALTGERLFASDDPNVTMQRVLHVGMEQAPSRLNPLVPGALDTVVLRGASAAREARFASALEMADAIEQATPLASHRTVGKWVSALAARDIESRARVVSRSEQASALAPAVPIPEADADPEPHAEPDPEPRAPLVAVPTPALEDTRSVVRPQPTAAASPIEATRLEGPTPGRRLALWVAVGLLVALSMAYGLARGSRGPPVRGTAAPAEAMATTEPTVASADAPPAMPTLASEALSPRVEESPGPLPSTSPSAPPDAPSARVPTARPARCTPPFYYENGFKRWKPGCL